MKLVSVCLSVCLLGLIAITARSVENEAGPRPDGNADRLLIAAARSVADMQRVTAKPFKMGALPSILCRAPRPDEIAYNNPHGDYYCHVFVDDGGLTPMRTGEGTYPVGSIIVKQKFSDARARATELYTLMRKMEPGYDPEQGDWEYSVVNRKATQVLARGKIESCIACHLAHAETDYVTRFYLTDELEAEEP